MAKYQVRQMDKLAARRVNMPKGSVQKSIKAFKRPGSMNRHKQS